MKKKLLAAMMCVCMMATALVGCGKTDSGAATDSKTEESVVCILR